MKSALQAFIKTTTELGIPGVWLFLTDDPSGDKNFFPEMLLSLKMQQQVYDLQSTPPNEVNLPHPSYDPEFTKQCIDDNRN